MAELHERKLFPEALRNACEAVNQSFRKAINAAGTTSRGDTYLCRSARRRLMFEMFVTDSDDLY